MTNLKILRALYILVLLYSGSSVAAQQCTGQLNKVKIFFGNGMLNNYQNARRSLEEIEYITRKTLRNFKLDYGLSYNQKENPVVELLEVTKHKMQDNWQSFLLWLRGTRLAPQWFRSDLVQVVRRNSYRSFQKDADLRRHVKNYWDSIQKCWKVIVVAHSQGNFYANHAWNVIYGTQMNGIMLNRIKPLGIVGVASPTTMIGSPLYYSGFQDDAARFVTLKNDWVINSVRTVNPSTIRANTYNRKTGKDWKNHSFVDAYMAGSPSGARILTFIKQLAHSLETLPFYHIPVSSQTSVEEIGYDPFSQILEERLSDNSIWRCYHTPAWFVDIGFGEGIGTDPGNPPDVDHDALEKIRCEQVD